MLRGSCPPTGRSPQASPTPLRAVRITIADHAEFGQTLSRDDAEIRPRGQRWRRADGSLREGRVSLGGAPSHGTVAGLCVPARCRPRAGRSDAESESTLGSTRSSRAPPVRCTGQRRMRCRDQQTASGGALFRRDNLGASSDLRATPRRQLDVTSLTVRITEFTVGRSRASSPCRRDLPPTSAYTYAVDVSADEFLIGEVRRARAHSDCAATAISMYVDNFVGFPVGAAVPLGYYDETTHAWIAQENGHRSPGRGQWEHIIDVTGDGNADSADATVPAARDHDHAQELDAILQYTNGNAATTALACRAVILRQVGLQLAWRRTARHRIAQW